MFENTPGFSGARFCGLLLDDCGDSVALNSWTIEVPENKSEVEQPVMPEVDSPTIKVLQLSDIHMDLNYDETAPGSNCGEPLCCQAVNGPADSPDQAAGHWGDKECGIPSWTFRDMLVQIAAKHPVSDKLLMTFAHNASCTNDPTHVVSSESWDQCI
jgi:sphingomyelin phosphodiesterase